MRIPTVFFATAFTALAFMTTADAQCRNGRCYRGSRTARTTTTCGPNGCNPRGRSLAASSRGSNRAVTYQGRRAEPVTPGLVRVLGQPVPEGATHWTTRQHFYIPNIRAKKPGLNYRSIGRNTVAINGERVPAHATQVATQVVFLRAKPKDEQAASSSPEARRPAPEPPSPSDRPAQPAEEPSQQQSEESPSADEEPADVAPRSNNQTSGMLGRLGGAIDPQPQHQEEAPLQDEEPADEPLDEEQEDEDVAAEDEPLVDEEEDEDLRDEESEEDLEAEDEAEEDDAFTHPDPEIAALIDKIRANQRETDRLIDELGKKLGWKRSNETPADDLADADMPEQTTPDTPVADTPVEDTPIADTPVEDTPIADTPVEDTPIADTPVEDTPVADTPVEDTPIADTPVEDTPIADTPVEDTPIADTPLAGNPSDCPGGVCPMPRDGSGNPMADFPLGEEPGATGGDSGQPLGGGGQPQPEQPLAEQPQPEQPQPEQPQPEQPQPPVRRTPDVALTANSYQEAVAIAKRENKLIVIDFYADWCAPCRRMLQSTIPTMKRSLLMREGFVFLKVNIDHNRQQFSAWGVRGIPDVRVVSPDGTAVISKKLGYQSVGQMTSFLEGSLRSWANRPR